MALGAGFTGAWFAAARKQAAAHLLEGFSPAKGRLAFGATELTQPKLQTPANAGKRQAQRRDTLLQSSAKLCGADEVVSQQAGEPFFSGHIGRLELQLCQVHLGLQVA